MTAINATIDGMPYLDKPAEAANLFQTITRPKRSRKSPVTFQRKDFWRAVDCIGLARDVGNIDAS